jgi:hypothetical protein
VPGSDAARGRAGCEVRMLHQGSRRDVFVSAAPCARARAQPLDVL